MAKGTKTPHPPRDARVTSEQAAGVRRLVRENVAAIEHLEPQALKPTLEVLLHARTELRKDLAKWMRTVEDPTERFTAHKMRVMLRSLEGSIDALGIRMGDMLDMTRHPNATAADRAMADGLKKGSRSTGPLAAKNLEHEIVRLGHIFGESLVGPQINIATMMARGNKMLAPRLETSAKRYGAAIGNDLRFQLAVGVARGETFEQMVQRLRRLGGPTGPVAVRGIFGQPNAIVEDIPEGLFVRYRHFAERYVRTEMMNAYNVQHDEGIRELNNTRSKGEPVYMRRWDAAADMRVCSECKYLDGKLATVGGLFVGGYDQPPAHPNCRCICVAWLQSWAADMGEISADDVKGAAERAPAAERKGNAITITAPERPIAPPKPTEDESFKPISSSKHTKLLEAHEAKLTDEEKDAQTKYGITWHRHVNNSLRTGERHPNEEHAARIDKVVKDLDSAIAKSAAPQNMVVYRGTDHPGFADLKVGDRVIDKGYTSTSLDKGTAGGFAGKSGTVFHIEVPKGFATAPVGGASEAEFLLPRGSKFEVTGVTKGAKGEQTIVKMRAETKLEDKLAANVNPPEERKNPKRVEAARKAGEVSAERRREIFSAVKSNLPSELHVVWDKEGHKYMRQEAGRIKGVKDRVNAASKISQAFTETYGSGGETAFGNEGDRFFKRAEIEAKHAETWADEQERKYYEQESKRARHDAPDEWSKPPKVTNDDDPPF